MYRESIVPEMHSDSPRCLPTRSLPTDTCTRLAMRPAASTVLESPENKKTHSSHSIHRLVCLSKIIGHDAQYTEYTALRQDIEKEKKEHGPCFKSALVCISVC